MSLTIYRNKIKILCYLLNVIYTNIPHIFVNYCKLKRRGLGCLGYSDKCIFSWSNKELRLIFVGTNEGCY